MTEWTIKESRRCWKDKNYDTMTCYMGMDGRVPLGELIAHLAEHHPQVDPMTVELNYATAKWDDATPRLGALVLLGCRL